MRLVFRYSVRRVSPFGKAVGQLGRWPSSVAPLAPAPQSFELRELLLPCFRLQDCWWLSSQLSSSKVLDRQRSSQLQSSQVQDCQELSSWPAAEGASQLQDCHELSSWPVAEGAGGSNATLWRSSCTSSLSLTASSLRCSRVPSPAPAASCAAASLSPAQAVHLCCSSGRNLSDLALLCQQPLPWTAQVKQSLQPWHWQYGVGSSPETDDILVPVRSKMLERK